MTPDYATIAKVRAFNAQRAINVGLTVKVGPKEQPLFMPVTNEESLRILSNAKFELDRAIEANMKALSP